MAKRTKSWILLVVAVVVLSVATFGWFSFRERSQTEAVQVEGIERRDLVATVAASGKIEPERMVNISADTMGRVTELAVKEGERVEQGQFLMLIDPESAESAVQMGDAGLGAAQASLNTQRIAVETAQANLDLALRNEARARELNRDQIVSLEELDRTESEVKIRTSELDRFPHNMHTCGSSPLGDWGATVAEKIPTNQTC